MVVGVYGKEVQTNSIYANHLGQYIMSNAINPLRLLHYEFVIQQSGKTFFLMSQNWSFKDAQCLYPYFVKKLRWIIKYVCAR